MNLVLEIAQFLGVVGVDLALAVPFDAFARNGDIRFKVFAGFPRIVESVFRLFRLAHEGEIITVGVEGDDRRIRLANESLRLDDVSVDCENVKQPRLYFRGNAQHHY